MKSYPCPACGFLVFDQEPGSYEICPVCDWEDDHVQLRYPLAGGANVPLVEYQGTVTKSLTEIRLNEIKSLGLKRCAEWRPLTKEDIEKAPGGPTDGRSYFNASADQAIPSYYWEVT